jgi:hypothetical protein
MAPNPYGLYTHRLWPIKPMIKQSNMKIKFEIFFIIFSLTSISTFCQNIEIKIYNPLVRQYQGIFVYIDFPFFNNYIESQLKDSFDFSHGGLGPFSKLIYPKDTGEFSVGPIDFVLNSIKYHSNIIKLKVLPELGPKEGTFINSYYSKEKTYILIEQIYKNKIQKIKNSSGTSNVITNNGSTITSTNTVTGSSSFSYKGNSKDDTNIKFNLVSLNLKGDNIEVKSTGSDEILKVGKSRTINDSLSYSIKCYEITNNSGKTIKLSREYFQNLKSDYVLPEIKIK